MSANFNSSTAVNGCRLTPAKCN